VIASPSKENRVSISTVAFAAPIPHAEKMAAAPTILIARFIEDLKK
jgi:hypothetical protein